MKYTDKDFIVLKNEINQRYSQLSKTNKAISDFVLNNYLEIPGYTITDLARECSVSQGSITNYVKTFGYSDYKDFKTNILRYATSPKVVEEIEEEQLTIAETYREIYDNMFRSNIELLEATQQALNPDVLYKIAQLIIKSKRIHLFGFGASYYVLQNFGHKLKGLGIDVIVSSDIYAIQALATLSSKDDLIICLSKTGESTALNNALAISQRNGATNVFITENDISEIQKFCDINLLLPECPNHFEFIGTRAIQTTVLETLVYMIISLNKGKFVPTVEKINTNVKKIKKSLK